MKRVFLLYHTKTGHTLDAAKAMAEGLKAAGNEVRLVAAKEFNPQEMKNYDLLLVGSPCWGGSMGAGISGPIAKALNQLENEVQGKPCAGFSVNGNLGGKNTVAAMGAILKQKGCSVYIEGPVAKGGAPLSLWKGPDVTAEDLAKCREFGQQLVKRAFQG